MGKLRSAGLRLAVAILSLSAITGCGGGSHPGPPLFPGRVNLSPVTATSLTLGSTLNFTASFQTSSGTTLNTTITFISSDTSILNVSPGGVACAGQWDAAFTTCTPGATGPVTVTATALGANSTPTYVFVHPPIDSISVVGVNPNGVQVQEPCLSQTQSMTVEAHAYSQGNDITSSVGPFTWSANNSSVVNLVPLTNTTLIPGSTSTFNFATNQASATANTPGITYIYATANGVTSTSFQQPNLTNSLGAGSPLLDFFATCPVQNIALELGAPGSGQTTFAVSKGSSNSLTAVATITDIMGNSSLPRTDGGIVLSKIPLTWTSSQPGSIGTAATGCTQSCNLALSAAGSATITASCSPPTCNVGFPLVPASLSTPTQISDCTTFFQSLFPHLIGCQQVIPAAAYASPMFINPPSTPLEISPIAAISGTVEGSPVSPPVFAASTGCAHELPSSCSTSAYYVSSASSAGNQNPLPVPPNSFLFDPTGTRVWMGSDFGAQIVNPASFGTANSAFSSLGTVTGKVLATSLRGTSAVFSDTLHTPNQVYVVNSGSTSSPTILKIPSASMAAFSPDELKLFIVGGTNGTSLYIQSPLQALQGPISLDGSAKALASSPNGAFTFIAEASSGAGANLTAYANCNNQKIASIALPTDPILMKVLPALPGGTRDSSGNLIPPGVHIFILDSTGFDIVTTAVSSTDSLCPQGLTTPTLQRIELGQGTLQPLNFFYSADDTLLYIVNAGSSSIVVYSLINGAVIGGIELQNNAVPVTADMSSDGGTIVIAGSDGMLHEISTAIGGSDSVPISFPNLPNFLNPFCSLAPNGGPCTLNVTQPKP